MAIDAYIWMNDDNEGDDAVASSGQSRDDDVEPPIDEEICERTQGLMRRGASRSRSPEERASGSNDAIRLLRRGASRLRSASRASGEASRSSTPPKKHPKK